MITTWRVFDCLCRSDFDARRSGDTRGMCRLVAIHCSDEMIEQFKLFLDELSDHLYQCSRLGLPEHRFLIDGYVSDPGSYDHTRRGIVHLLSLMYDPR